MLIYLLSEIKIWKMKVSNWMTRKNGGVTGAWFSQMNSQSTISCFAFLAYVRHLNSSFTTPEIKISEPIVISRLGSRTNAWHAKTCNTENNFFHGINLISGFSVHFWALPFFIQSVTVSFESVQVRYIYISWFNTRTC